MKSAHKAEKAKAFPVFFVALSAISLIKNPRGKEEKKYAV